jgi:hypothetical protein
MRIKANKATRYHGDELGIGAPAFISRDTEATDSFKWAYRGADVASNNIPSKKNADSRFSEDYGGEPLFI